MLSFKSMAVMAALAVSAVTHAQEPIKIGFMAELSGPQGALGQDQYDAFMMVVDRNGGRLGGVPVQVLREDTQLKPDVASQIAQKLIEKEQVPIITGITFSSIMMAVHKPITDNEVFLIGTNAGPSPIAGNQCSPYAFITSWQADQAAEAVGKYAADQGYKRVFTLAPNYQAGKDVINGFRRYYQAPLVGENYTPLNQPDFSSELAQIAAQKPDAVFVFYPGGLGVSFVRQFHQAGLAKNIPLLSVYAIDSLTLPAQKEAALGMITGNFWGPDFTNEANERFVAEFEEKFKRIPSSYAAQSYDAALLLDSAISKVNGKVSDKQAFAAALKEADFESVRGSFRFNRNNFPIQDMHVFKVAKDGKGRLNLETLATPLVQTQDAYVGQCSMSD